MPDLNNDEKLCPRCGVVKNKSEFSKKKVASGVCSWCKNCVKERRKEKTKEHKQAFVDYKGGKCSHCGYSKCLSALEFHCIDPKNKDSRLKNIKSRTLNKKTKDILDTCILLCVNCHRLEHHKIYLNGKQDNNV